MENIIIDGKKIAVKEGTTILEAARKLGIEIPTLCFHEALGPYGACRVCMVEIITSRGSKLTTACTYPAWEGLEVKTDSEKVRKARRFVIELLLARCSDVPAIKELAKNMGIEGSDLTKANDDCILCGLCIRVCSNVIGRSAISFTGRGEDRKVETPFEAKSDACIGCGACAAICPTGAIKIEDIDKVRKMHRCHTEFELATCKECGASLITIKELEFIKKKIDLPDEVFQLCQKCKRKRLREEVGKNIKESTFARWQEGRL